MAEYKAKLLNGIFTKASKCLMSDGTTNIEDYVQKRTFGTSVALTDNVSYSCTADGYFHVQIADGTNNYCYMYIGSVLVWGGMYVKNSAAAQIHNTIYVRKGMSIRFHGSGATGSFIPIA